MVSFTDLLRELFTIVGKKIRRVFSQQFEPKSLVKVPKKQTGKEEGAGKEK